MNILLRSVQHLQSLYRGTGPHLMKYLKNASRASMSIACTLRLDATALVSDRVPIACCPNACMSHRSCSQIRKRLKAGEQMQVDKMKIPMIDLPLGATEDRVCGTIDIEKALTEGAWSRPPLVHVLCSARAACEQVHIFSTPSMGAWLCQGMPFLRILIRPTC